VCARVCVRTYARVCLCVFGVCAHVRVRVIAHFRQISSKLSSFTKTLRTIGDSTFVYGVFFFCTTASLTNGFKRYYACVFLFIR